MEFETVFDVTQVGFKSWWFSAFGLIFVSIGIYLVINRDRITFNAPKGIRKIIPFWVLGFSLLWTITSFSSSFRGYIKSKSALNEGTAKIVEGYVEDFVPMPHQGHAQEKFRVGDTTFSYSDYRITSGFNNTKSHGGPIDEGKYVRIHHRGNIILKLEIRNE